MSLRIGSLCSGYGGLDTGARSALGAEVAWHCDNDAGATRILAHHHPDSPNHGDLTTTDWSDVEPVDIITAGWPCQPWSFAGQRKGPNDERAIWPEIARAVRELRPRYVALENVGAIVGVGELARALGDLAALGFDAEWGVFRASDVGAPHRRERCFILAAHPGHYGREGSPEQDGRASAGIAVSPRGDLARRGRRDVSVPVAGRMTLLPTPTTGPDTGNGHARNLGREARLLPTLRTSDTNGGGVHGDGGLDLRTAVTLVGTNWSAYTAAIARWEHLMGRTAPSPTEPGRNGPCLSPRLPEWMMGLPDGHVTAVPGLTRSQQLHAIGNGVVPQQAAVAYSVLLGRLAEDRVAA